MSDYRLIRDVTNGLRLLLEEEFAVAVPEIDPALKVTTTPPPDGATSPEGNLSFWLYHVTENEFVKNQPLINRAPPDANSAGAQHNARIPPLAINLYYLLTPLAESKSLKDHEQLGKAMEVLYDNAIVFLRAGNQTLHELRISLCRMTLEEHTRVWDALRAQYRLSVCYQVRVARIDSRRQRVSGRVIEQANGFGAFENAGAG